MKTLALITARGGSKGLPGKNIKMLCGKPLIAWTIESALITPEITKVIVSTDCPEIATISKKFGAEVPFLRPDNLANDTSSSIDVVLHAVSFLESINEYYDNIILLEPTSPLRKKSDLSTALKYFYKNYSLAHGIISVGEIHMENPVIAKRIEREFILPFFSENTSYSQRQQFPKAYFPYGVLYCVKTSVLKATKAIYTDKSLPYYIERWQNYEIDDIYDFMCVESILKNKLKEFAL